jgi:APA family basic amino acid/polyamine antiporter
VGVGDVLDIIGAVAVVCASYTSFFVELEDLELRDVAIGGIIVVGLLFGGEAHTAAIAATAAAAIPLDTSYSMGDLRLTLVAGLFAFGGWHMVTYSAEEAQNPERTISFALIICTLMVTGCYVLLNAVYLYVLPMEEVASSDQAVADAADTVVGQACDDCGPGRVLDHWGTLWHYPLRPACLLRHG